MPPPRTAQSPPRWLAGELDCWPGSLFVLTTRKPAWEADRHGALDARASEYALLGLTEAARNSYVRRYFPKVAESEVSRRSAAELAYIRRLADEQAKKLLEEIIEAREHGRLPQQRGAGLLLAPDPRTVVFAHLTFQEYLAFEHARKSPGKPRWLGNQASVPRWREPILLGQVDDDFRREFYEGLLSEPGAVASVKALVEACALEKEPPAAPLVEAFQRAIQAEPAPPPWWKVWESPVKAPIRPTAADLAVLLGLYSGPPPREVLEAVRLLRDHPDETVRALAARLRGEETPATGPQRRVIPGLELERVPVRVRGSAAPCGHSPALLAGALPGDQRAILALRGGHWPAPAGLLPAGGLRPTPRCRSPG